MSFVKRRVEITINLGEGQFGENLGSDVTLGGLRTQVLAQNTNGYAQGDLQLRVYGLTMDMMNRLTILGPVTQDRRQNSILVAAGDDGGVMSVIHQGTIAFATAEYNGSPQVAFNVVSMAATLQAVKPVNALSYQGPADVATIMESLATSMGMAFENNGVSVQLSNPYFPGTAVDQLRACARAANVYYTMDRGTLAIWPKTSFRSGDPVVISSQTGMIGYPAISGDHVIVSVPFNADVAPGKQVDIRDSVLTVANGIWNVYKVTHVLESETPGGQWRTDIECYKMAPQ